MNIGKIIAVTNSEDLARENEHRVDERETERGDRHDLGSPTDVEFAPIQADEEVCVQHQPARAASGHE